LQYVRVFKVLTCSLFARLAQVGL